MKTTQAEDRYLKSLQRLIKKCPKTCWLFAASNGLFLMRLGKDGEVAATKTHCPGMDQDYVIGKATGPWIDGGDW